MADELYKNEKTKKLGYACVINALTLIDIVFIVKIISAILLVFGKISEPIVIDEIIINLIKFKLILGLFLLGYLKTLRGVSSAFNQLKSIRISPEYHPPKGSPSKEP